MQLKFTAGIRKVIIGWYCCRLDFFSRAVTIANREIDTYIFPYLFTCLLALYVFNHFFHQFIVLLWFCQFTQFTVGDFHYLFSHFFFSCIHTELVIRVDHFFYFFSSLKAFLPLKLFLMKSSWVTVVLNFSLRILVFLWLGTVFYRRVLRCKKANKILIIIFVGFANKSHFYSILSTLENIKLLQRKSIPSSRKKKQMKKSWKKENFISKYVI